MVGTAVVALLIGGTATYAAAAKTVTLDIDGQTSTVRVFGGTVESVLKDNSVEFDADDVIDKELSDKVSDGDTITVGYSRPITVIVDGRSTTRITHQHTVGAVLEKLGIEPSKKAWINLPLDETIPRGGVEIIVSNPKKIKVVFNGKKKVITTAEPTAVGVVKAAGFEVDGDDEINLGRGALVSPGDKVVITRIKVLDKTRVVDVDPKVVYREDDSLYVGETKVLDPGKVGKIKQQVIVTLANGKKRDDLVLESKTLSRSATRVVAKGTKKRPVEEPAETTAAPSGGSSPSAKAVPSGSVWDRLAACESGGNWSINTGNGYYGGLQFSLATWRSVGGPGYPHQQSREVQIKYAEILQARSGWGQWGCAYKIGLI